MRYISRRLKNVTEIIIRTTETNGCLDFCNVFLWFHTAECWHGFWYHFVVNVYRWPSHIYIRYNQGFVAVSFISLECGNLHLTGFKIICPCFRIEYSSSESGILRTVHHKRSIFADSILLQNVREEDPVLKTAA